MTEVGKTSKAPASVALVRGGALGDFVLTLPVASALRAAHPGARFVVAGRPERAALAAPEAVLDTDGAAWSALYRGELPAAVQAALADCRCLVAFVASDRPDAGPLAQALRRLCPEAHFHDPRPRPGDGRHMAAQLLDPLRPAHPGLPATPTPRLPATPAVTRTDLVVVHPGSGSPAKCWPARRFADLVGALSDRGHRCVLLWGPAEAERGADLARALPAGLERVSPSTPTALAALLASARLYVGNDSGPGHLAAAAGVATVSLFGPTDARLWRPLGPAATCVQAPRGDLTRLAVPAVLDAVEQALEAGGATR